MPTITYTDDGIFPQTGTLSDYTITQIQIAGAGGSMSVYAGNSQGNGGNGALITLSIINDLNTDSLKIYIGKGGPAPSLGGINLSGGAGGGSSQINDENDLLTFAIAGGGGGGGVIVGALVGNNGGYGGLQNGSNGSGASGGSGGGGGNGGSGGSGSDSGQNGGNTTSLSFEGGSGGGAYQSSGSYLLGGSGFGSCVGGNGASSIKGGGGGGGGYGGGGGGGGVGLPPGNGGGGGGGGGSYYNSIFLSGSYSQYENSGGNPDGTVNGLDGYVTITFIVNPAICFMSDCDILLSNFTTKNITELSVSDEVLGYLSNRAEKIKKILKRTHFIDFLEETNKPYSIEKNAFGPDTPNKDIHLSGHHRIITKMEDNHFVGIQTFQLPNCKKETENSDEVTYYHVLLENKGVGLIVNNLPVEDCIEN